MTKRDKLRQKLRNSQKSVKFTELETLLLRFGFMLTRVKGSHHFYQYLQDDINEIIVVPLHGNEVKPKYVKDAIVLLDELYPVEDVEETQDEPNEDEE
jgi:predicted RNA binding protein YcfA (HicA-like mRNA interferase family)